MATAIVSATTPAPVPATIRALQFSVYAMTVLGTLMLGMGQRTATLPVLAAIVAISAYQMTDLRRWIVVAPRAAAWLGVAAIGVAAYDLGRFQRETWLLALANLLVYLQFILSYQAKHERIYWELIGLSVMQTAVATALNFSLAFGVVLIAFMAAGLSALALMHLASLDRPGVAVAAGEDFTRAAPGNNSVDRAVASPLDAARVRGFWTQLGKLAVAALGITAVLFFAVPRIGRNEWQPTGSGANVQVVGATDHVKLGEIGAIMTSVEAALQVQFLNFKKSPAVPYPLLDEPYLRGAVLNEYSRGEWRRRGQADVGSRLPQVDANDLPFAADLVLQRITIEPLDIPTLYCVYPFRDATGEAPLLWNESARYLARPEGNRNTKFTYELVTTGFLQGRQIPFTPVEPRERRLMSTLLQTPGDDSLVGLRRVAGEIVQDIAADDVIARAKALTDHLRFGGRFFYSLEPPRNERDLDPIENFLLHDKAGHCEYFASALTLMARSQGLPARMVVGFHGGDFNRFGGFYQVRQMNSHAWVEVYVPAEALPESMPAPRDQWLRGAWLRLDPTPVASQPNQAATVTYTINVARQAADFVRFLWSSYVLGLDAQKQHAAIYAPLAEGARSLYALVTSPEDWRETGRQIARTLGIGRFGWLGGEWFNWRAGLVASTTALLLGLLGRWLRPRLGPMWAATRWMRRMASSAALGEASFYRRYEEMLARHACHRTAAQTPQEFARQLAAQLRRAARTAPVAETPLDVAATFYRVRYGGRPLDKHQLIEVEQAIARLESALTAASDAPDNAALA